MKKILGLALLLVAAEAQAQSVESEMTKLRQLAENCLLSIQSCGVTTACRVFRSYNRELMPDGPAGYYDLHVPDKSMNLGNGKLVSDAVKTASKASKAVEQCTPT